MDNYNLYINNIYNKIISISKLSFDNNRQLKLKKVIKYNLNIFVKNNKNNMKNYDQNYIINHISTNILNKLQKKKNYTNIYEDNKPISTRENLNINNFTNYKQQRNELFSVKNPEEINFNDPLYKPKNKETHNNNNNLDNFFSNINDNDNDDNKYKIDFQDNKNYEDEETLDQRLNKINKEREILNNDQNNNNNNNNNNEKDIVKQIKNEKNNNDFNIKDVQEILVLTTNKIQELTLLYNEINKKVNYLYNKK